MWQAVWVIDAGTAGTSGAGGAQLAGRQAVQAGKLAASANRQAVQCSALGLRLVHCKCRRNTPCLRAPSAPCFAGDLFIVGSFGTIALEPGGWIVVGSQNLTTAGGTDAFVAKLSAAAGAVQWASRMGSPLNDNGWAAAALDGGDVLVAGEFRNVTTGFATLTTAGDVDGFVARLSGATGTLVWATGLGASGTSPSDAVYSMAASPANGIEVLGRFTSTMQVGSTTLTSAGNTDVFIASLNAATGAPL